VKPSAQSRSDGFLEAARRIQRAKRLLVIDDHDSFRTFVGRALAPRGLEIKGAAGGVEGIEIAKSFRPQVVLLDWILKGASGEAVARQLRTLAFPTFTLLLSAVMSSCDPDRARQAGADGFMTKNEIYKLIMPGASRPSRQTRPQGPVLIIEDDPGTQEFIRYAAEGRGLELEVASDGLSGLQKARERAPSVIFLDLTLPGINGAEVLKILRADESTKRIPVVVMTALTDSSGVVESLLQNLPADDFIHKPFAEGELTERIERWANAAAVTPVVQKPAPAGSVLTRGRVRVDLERRKVFAAGRPRSVPGVRFDLLRLLIAHREPLSTERILAEVWPDSRDPATLKKTVQRLREDLALDGDPIVAVHHGYQLIG
jgi:DNA-binding response OmpR family regulator